LSEVILQETMAAAAPPRDRQQGKAYAKMTPSIVPATHRAP
jgi:hypothetical protein